MTQDDILALLDTLNEGPYTLTPVQREWLPKNKSLAQTHAWLPSQFSSVRQSLADQLGLDISEVPARLALNQCQLDIPVRISKGRASRIAARDLMNLGDPLHRLYVRHLRREPDPEGYAWWLAEWERQFLNGIEKPRSAPA